MTIRYPIGIQSFSFIREENYLYIDKTAYIHQLIDSGKYYFLSRPRRFGKSLLLSTIEAYFQGKKELFDGLAISRLTDKWEEFPVFHFNFGANTYRTLDDLNIVLNWMLDRIESDYNIETTSDVPSIRFSRLIKSVWQLTGKRVVILIDEYDLPLLNLADNDEEQQKIRAALKAFYGNLKTMDDYIRFGMLTGVTRFSKVSIFSDLNNLNDISMSDSFAGICGITEDELHCYFDRSISEFAAAKGVDKSEIMRRLKNLYDGYHFSEAMLDVYNPFSILCALYNGKFGSYWFETGTPTFLMNILKNADFTLSELQHWETNDSGLRNTDILTTNPIGVLYQAGYLTIKAYDEESGVYELDYPNTEVKRGLLEFLLPYYANLGNSEPFFVIARFAKALAAGDADAFMRQLSTIFAGYNYEIVRDCENHYQNVIYLLFSLLGYRAEVEKRTSFSRSDLVVETDRFVYIFEFKYNSTAAAAMKQIESRRYAAPYENGRKEIVCIAVNFSPATRNIDEWLAKRITPSATE